MTVKYEDEVYEYIKGGNRQTCAQIAAHLGYKYHRVWTALMQLEARKLVSVNNHFWKCADEY